MAQSSAGAGSRPAQFLAIFGKGSNLCFQLFYRNEGPRVLLEDGVTGTSSALWCQEGLSHQHMDYQYRQSDQQRHHMDRQNREERMDIVRGRDWEPRGCQS